MELLQLRRRGRDPIKHERNTGPRPKKVCLIAPHTNEHGAVLQLQKELRKRLKEEGIETETKNTTDMMERAWELRIIAKDRSPMLYEQCFSPVLMIDDLLRRARVLKTAIIGDERTIALEMHARKEGLIDEGVWEELDGTGILISTSVASSFENTWKDHRQEIYHSRHFRFEHFEEIAQIMEFDIRGAIEELRDLIWDLHSHDHCLMLIEVPSYFRRLDEDHPMYKYYYGERGPWVTSQFESAYASGYRYAAFDPENVEAVLSALRLPG